MTFCALIECPAGVKHPLKSSLNRANFSFKRLGMGAFLTENFPTRIRGSGQGFAYNFGRGVAALNPTFVGLLSATLTLGQSIGVFAIIAYGILIVAALLLPETKGRELTADA